MRHQTRRSVATVGVFAVALLLTASAVRQTAAQRPSEALLKADHMPAQVDSAPIKLPGHLGTMFRETDDFDPVLQEGVAAALRNQPIPTARLMAFRELDRPDLRLDGWDAKLLDVNRDQGTVTVRITPFVTSARGVSTTMMTCLDEIYQFRDGRLVLLGTQPVGMMAMIHD